MDRRLDDPGCLADGHPGRLTQRVAGLEG